METDHIHTAVLFALYQSAGQTEKSIHDKFGPNGVAALKEMEQKSFVEKNGTEYTLSKGAYEVVSEMYLESRL